MTIWLIAIVLLVLFAALGRAQGAIQMLVSFVGLLLATFLAVPLGPLLRPLFPMLGVTNPVWLWLLPPVAVFALISVIFLAAGFVVHRQVVLWYKYKTDDMRRLKWERLNKGVGLAFGTIVGAFYGVLIGLLIYVSGYSTVQVGSSDTAPALIRFVNQVRQEMRDSGLDALLAPLDPAPARYYEVADILGLIYNNPVLETRIANYPPFLALGERTEFQEIAADTQLNEMIKSQASITDLINHPKVQTVLANQEIMQHLLALDLKDLREYLMTGRSARFEDEKILGRWRVDALATLVLEKRKKPDITASEMGKLKKVATTLFPGITLVATADNKAILKVELSDQAKKAIDELLNPKPPPPPRPVDPDYAPPPQIDPRMAQRYGIRPGAGPLQAQPPPPPAALPGAPKPPPPHPLSDLLLSAQGTWERAGDKYQLKLQNERGKEEAVEALVEGDKMKVIKGDKTIIFLRT